MLPTLVLPFVQMPAMNCRLLLALLCLGTGLLAQNEEEEGRAEARRKERHAEAAEKGDVDLEKERAKISQEEWERLTPEERLARSVTHGASRYCRFTAAVRPAKLMPGQSGVLMISAILQGQAVLPSPAPLEYVGQPQQGWVTIGSLSMHPAKEGKLAQAYLGRPVYDNTAVIEVPVSMAADAEIGKKQSLTVDMRFDLYDGNSAQAIGRFIDRASVEIEVGEALDPPVQGGMPKPRLEAEPVAPAGSQGTATSNSPPAHPIQANAVVPEAPAPKSAEPGPAASNLSSPPPAVAEEGLPVLLLVGGGALLLAIVLMLARKK